MTIMTTITPIKPPVLSTSLLESLVSEDGLDEPPVVPVVPTLMRLDKYQFYNTCSTRCSSCDNIHKFTIRSNVRNKGICSCIHHTYILEFNVGDIVCKEYSITN